MKRIGLIVKSNLLSGAEKRFIRIFREISLRRIDNMQFYLLVNKKLYDLFINNEEFKDIKSDNRLINSVIVFPSINSTFFNRIVPYKIKQLIEHYYINNIIIKNSINIVHSGYGGGGFNLSKSKRYISCFEITSPKVADSIYMTKRKNYVYRNFNYFRCVSESVEKRVLANNNDNQLVPNDRIYKASLPYFIPPNRILPLNVKENHIVFASRFIERKNPVLFASVVKEFLKLRKGWIIYILGKGSLDYKLKEILSKEIETKTVYIGYTENLYEVLAKSKIYVSLISTDNYPSQSILEAMYMKNAIVASNTGSTHRLVKDGINGMLVELNKEAILEKLMYITEPANSQKLAVMGEESYSLLEDEFDNNKYIQELLDFYDKLYDEYNFGTHDDRIK